MIEYDDASPEVRAVYDDILATRQTDYINNFWKVIAHDPASARKAGMTDAMFAEVMAVVGMANETNRLASGYRVEVDERFQK